MRIRMICEYAVFVGNVESKNKTILAGRYLASVCKADFDSERGIQDFELMQKAYDRLYPGRFNIMVFRYSKDKKIERAYQGNSNNEICISILWILVDGKSDFFGLLRPLAIVE